MDEINQLGKNLNQAQLDTEAALRNYRPEVPRIEHARDIFDSFIPFEMTFRTEPHDVEETISLSFAPPPSNCCCVNCLCAQCEFFTGITDSTLTMTHPIKPGSVSVLVNEVLYLDFTVGFDSITLGFTPIAEDEIKVCYTFEVLLFGSTNCADCQVPAYTQLIDYPKDFDSVNVNEITTIVDFTAANGQFTAAVGASFASYIGHPTWAHTTQGLPPDIDTPIETIPISNVLAVIDGDPSTCSTSTAVVMRTGGTDAQPNGTGYSVFWEIHFPRAVKLCSASFGGFDPAEDASILYAGVDGTMNVTTVEGLNVNGGVVLSAFRFIVTRIIGYPSAFNLFGVPRVDLCDIRICVADVECGTIEAAGLLGLSPFN